ncbi:TetR/AcrR family transcriptional regulator [Amycolatopsis sp. 195334CR]|uniref:TetR/AcrR family transcriptional regulator n=1 Tax=Amycolatopsis sp. 195334CR TaxID=2814588 RepID=UPI001A906D79|nr:TetR/AcrR family transcriptional regulator [Amycolatopsis sp. 195334CR]MBN6036679.1 TetR/AcrR family transcriptional regulator [Amycolatopsis sp. 195334CR]
MTSATSRKQKAAETEAALKAAARRVFARQGYLNTKITDITAEAGRAAGSFYNHFAGKEELLEALLVDMFAEADEGVTEPGHDQDFSKRSAVRWHVAHFWRFYQEHLPEMVALRQAAMVNEDLGRRLRQLTVADQRHLGGHLANVANLPGDPELVTSAMTALMDQFAYTWLVAGGTGRDLPDDEAIDLLTDFVHRAITGGTALSGQALSG